MGSLLSQAEIDKLLGKCSTTDNFDFGDLSTLTSQEIDILGEIGNIIMGASATSLVTLLGYRVRITNPKVSIIKAREFKKLFRNNYVGVNLQYKEGFEGNTLLLFKEEDARLITDLMMCTEGNVIEPRISKFELGMVEQIISRILSSSYASIYSLFNKPVDFLKPEAFLLNFNKKAPEYFKLKANESLAQISFKIIVGDFLTSHIVKTMPISLAKTMVNELLKCSKQDMDEKAILAQMCCQRCSNELLQNRDINKLLNTPMQITVQMGRTKRLVRDILELTTSSVIKLDKLVGEPVDILANGKNLAKGEIVVLGEYFGVKIIDIVNVSKRI